MATLPNATGECTVTVTAPTATDNCAGVITGTTTDPLTYNTQGTYTITWTYDDGNGNTSTQTQTVIVDDVTAPTASNLAPLTVYCASDVPAPDPGLVSDAADNCGIPLVAWNRDDSDGGFNPEIITRYYTVTDGAGNQIEVTRVITVYGFVINTQPLNVDAFAGDDATFSVVATNADTFQWQISTDGGTSWVDIDGTSNPSALTDTLLINDVMVSQHGTLFRVLVSNSASSCAAVISDTATLSVGVYTVITNRTKTFRVNKN